MLLPVLPLEQPEHWDLVLKVWDFLFVYVRQEAKAQ
jgi:hypothetical protein